MRGYCCRFLFVWRRGKALIVFLGQAMSYFNSWFIINFVRRTCMRRERRNMFFPHTALWEEEEIISFLKTPELAKLGKASGEQGANKKGERQLAWSLGHKETPGHFLRGAGGLPLAQSRATMRPQK